jgi:hypothetical protein
MLYLVSYDLRTPGQDYPDLSAALKRMGAVKVLLSAWLLPSDSQPLDVHNLIWSQGKMDANDRMLVSEVTEKSAWRNLLASSDAVKELFHKYARP